ncbi:hyaluronidase [Parasteatoda tepidariorum]|uniref:hyaluronidase n=1 Tax=Parasteatoda tepidariorum TaxID=114398 RepID=UPI00077F8175|nr:hyaluronidase [Parasteatoda tepidariorum]
MNTLKRALCNFLYFTLLQSVTSFEVYWNVPTQQCLRNYGHDFTRNLKTYGILVNNGDKFQGEQITIFYESQLGFYPSILKNGTWVNGGLPQAANISKHLQRAAEDLQNTIKNESFNGIGVIDWEAWRPSWNFNWIPLDIYREKSREFARKQSSTLNDKEIEELAKHQWGNGARSYMLETLELSKKLRPSANWGYYLFPDCYNYVGKKPADFECSEKVKIENDKLSWLWNSSTGIFPSIYLYDNHLDHYTMEQRSYKDHEKLKEAIRVAPAEAKILPYINFHLKKILVPQGDFERMAAQAAAIGADGFIIWGSSSAVSSRTHCNEVNEYITQVLGPAVKKISRNAELCSRTVCHGNGHCTWPNDKTVTAWKEFLKEYPSFYKNEIVCKCKILYTGTFCGHQLNKLPNQ